MSDEARNPVANQPAREARALLRASRGGTLATQSDGQPFASLITPAAAPDGSVLMLLSGLSEHTRHLREEPRCSVLVAGAADGPNAVAAPPPRRLPGRVGRQLADPLVALLIVAAVLTTALGDLPDTVVIREHAKAA